MRPRSTWRSRPPSPQPRSAVEMATNAKWYLSVAEKIRVSAISKVRPDRLSRKTPAASGIRRLHHGPLRGRVPRADRSGALSFAAPQADPFGRGALDDGQA